MSVLIVVAHPDDEVLGCGGISAAMAKNGISVHTCILSGQAMARRHRPKTDKLHDDIDSSHKILGIETSILGDFPNIKFNTVPHLELVQFIEQAMSDTKADWIFTHHPSDLNNDHLYTSRACQAASRLYQRKSDQVALQRLYFMEIPSATDWAFPGNGNVFSPDTFFPIEDVIQQKLDALAAYENVMREFPHPRSKEVITGLAAFRGGMAGMKYAEAFQTAFSRLDIHNIQARNSPNL